MPALAGNSQVLAYARIFFANPVDTFELVCMASNIVDDFDEWGPVIQANVDGEYSPETSIERLRAARDRLFALHDDRPRPLWPWHVAQVAAWHQIDPGGRMPSSAALDPTELVIFPKSFVRESQTTLELLRRYPADQLDLQPTDKLPTARQLIWTLVLGQMAMGMLTERDDVLPGDMPSPPAALPELIAAYESAHREAIARLGALTEARLNNPVRVPITRRTIGECRRGDVLRMLLLDGIHHRGQLSVYQRLAGGMALGIHGPPG